MFYPKCGKKIPTGVANSATVKWIVAAVAAVVVIAGAVSSGCRTASVAGTGSASVPVPTSASRVPGSVIVHAATGIELVYIPAGSFMMGSPAGEKDRWPSEVQHRVTISKGFYMSKYEVTQAQYEKIKGANPSSFKGANLPVEQVSWADCHKFCRQAGLRLPTEAEWEYACRAGSTGAFGGTGTLGEMGWYYENAGDQALTFSSWSMDNLTRNKNQTHPVGQKKPNAWGLYDMHGNVWEWCSDRYGDYSTGDVTDPTGAWYGSDRVFRGGSWGGDAGDCRSARRGGGEPGFWIYALGFRVVLPSVK